MANRHRQSGLKVETRLQAQSLAQNSGVRNHERRLSRLAGKGAEAQELIAAGEFGDGALVICVLPPQLRAKGKMTTFVRIGRLAANAKCLIPSPTRGPGEGG